MKNQLYILFIIIFVYDNLLARKKPQISITKPQVFNTDKSKNQNSDFGIIKGTVYYPDTLNPKDFRVIAENVETKDTVSSTQIESRKKNTYSLKLKIGKYYIYAFTNLMPNTRAYFTEWVVCKQEPWCHSHEKVIVNVNAGKTIDKVNPVDWINLLID
ncbi:MAG: hypothetical protein IPP08_02100 [Chlorobiota bacterium]|nr:hypothetical protein [Chlorobiota bacterium]QQS66988.1 MAG: hypothetical protein IPP08_02100 [Chlorobiota bacterium]